MVSPSSTKHERMLMRYTKSIALLNITVQLALPVSLAFTPSIVAHAADKNQVLATEPYVLQGNDTIQSVAAQNNISVEQLQKINAMRKFTRPFEKLGSGAEIDIPLKRTQFELPSAAEPDDAKLAKQANTVGNFLQNSHSNRAFKDLARSSALNEVNAKANAEVTSWLNGKGKVSVKLDADRQFSLKNSQFEVLSPFWENPNNMVFVQGSLHRTDDRTQSNLGLGNR